MSDDASKIVAGVYNEYLYTGTSSPSAPTVTTTSVTEITTTTASSGGNVTSDGGASVTARGVCWNTSANPTTANSKTTDGTGTGSFTSSITGLSLGTTYHVRAYATNSQGTSYGADVEFTTSSSTAPTVTTTAVSSITGTTASSGGNVTSDGGASVTARGVCWSTSENPTTSDSKTTDSTGTGSFTSSITGLSANTTYHVRAYATNSVGTAYGADVSFTTDTTPTVTTTAISSITGTTASSGGNVTADGGESVTARGVCWNTSANPTTAHSKTTDDTGTGEFTSNITGLSFGTTYHVRAYATNSVGTAYGSDVSFTTKSPPTVTTTLVSNLTGTTAESGGDVTADGGASVTARGVCWRTSVNPTTGDSKTTDGTGTGSFASNITGLSINTTYHVRAYATNSVGTAYGNDVSFTTDTTPTVTTTAVSSITTTTADSGGNVTSDGGATVTARGVCWSTSANPTTADSKTTDGMGTGSFTSNITGLSPNTTYHVRAYATNSVVTSYGSDVAFTTSTTTPTVTTTAVSDITTASASSGGNVTSDGGATVTARGVCWSTSENPTTSDSKTTNGTGTGSFTSNLTELSAGTTHHVRAYATNSVGTSYGNQVVFSTLSGGGGSGSTPTPDPEPTNSTIVADDGTAEVQDGDASADVTGWEPDTPVSIDQDGEGNVVVTVGADGDSQLSVTVTGSGDNTQIDLSRDGQGDPSIQVSNGGQTRFTLQLVAFPEGTDTQVDFDDVTGRTTVTLGALSAPTLSFDLNGIVNGSTATISAAEDGQLAIDVNEGNGRRTRLLLVGYPEGPHSQITMGAGGAITGAVNTDQALSVFVSSARDAGDVVFTITYHAATAYSESAVKSNVVADPGDADSVTLGASGLLEGAVITVELVYGESDWFGYEECALKLLYWNVETGAYEAAGSNDVGISAFTGVTGDYGVDTTTRTVWAEVSQLGRFAIGTLAQDTVDAEEPTEDDTAGDEEVLGEDASNPSATPETNYAFPCGGLGVVNGLLMMLGIGLMKRRRT